MQNLIFWKNWISPSKQLVNFSFIFFIISVLYFVFCYFRGQDSSLSWGILSELSETPVRLDSQASTNLVVPAYLVTEQFVAQPMSLAPWVVWSYLVFFLVSIVLLATAISTLQHWAYYGGMTALMVVLISLRLDLLWGLTTPYITLLLILSLGGLSYYFQTFRPDIQVLTRFYAFSGLVLTLVLVGHFTTSQGHLYALLIPNSLPSALFLTVLFIFLNAYEIVRGLLWVATNGRNTQAFWHFALLTLIYLANVILVFLYTTKVINWNLLYISPYLVFIVSALLGLWGSHHRANLLGKYLPYQPSGALLYLTLGLLSFGLMGLAFGTANDPLTETIEDAILYSHTVMAILFFFYVFLNFGPLFVKGLAIHKVVFQPRIFGLGGVRLVGLLLIWLVLHQNKYFPIYQAFAGYYNALGDYETSQNDYSMAEINYKQALNYEFQNHKSNYALASLALLQDDNPTAGKYFKQALLKKPSAFAYAGLSRCLHNEDSFFEALFALREGVQRFPNNGELKLNLGYLFEKSKSLDSAFYYYQSASALANRTEIPASNILALAAKLLSQKSLDSLLNNSLPNNYVSYQANFRAIQKARLVKTEADIALELNADSSLNVPVFAYLYNSALNTTTLPPQNTQSPKLIDLITTLENNPNNESFHKDLLFSRAVLQYYQGDKILAFDLLSAKTEVDTSAKIEAASLKFWIMAETSKMIKISPPQTQTQAIELIRANPLNAGILSACVQFLNSQKQAKIGYDALMRAQKYTPLEPVASSNAIAIKQLYIMQCLELYLKDYASLALATLPNADYQSFLPEYKAKLALMEKARGNF